MQHLQRSLVAPADIGIYTRPLRVLLYFEYIPPQAYLYRIRVFFFFIVFVSCLCKVVVGKNHLGWCTVYINIPMSRIPGPPSRIVTVSCVLVNGHKR
jgi:hypothetical protein